MVPTIPHRLPAVTLLRTKGEVTTTSSTPFSKGKIMSKQAGVFYPLYNFLQTPVEGFELLAELALDMRW
jgi:hypothetical protein